MIKHTVTTDALLTLGTILMGDEHRDAIHIAVVSVKAHETMKPGQPVAISPQGNAYSVPASDSIGIIDPFLARGVVYGDHCWVLLNPRTITSLRHVWSHPALPDELPQHSAIPVDAEQTARLAIHAVAEDLGVSDEALMEGAEAWLAGHRYMYFGDDLSYGWDMPAFWNAYALLTGKDVPVDMQQSFFSCSC